jgi:hypothetical protein
MNPGQLWEQTLNRYSKIVQDEVIVINTPKTDESYITAYDYTLKYINKINPNYATLIEEICQELKEKKRFIDGVEKEGVYLVIPPFLNTIKKELALELKREYDAKISPITFSRRDDHGNIISTTRTKDDVWIGSKYIFLLYKIPKCMASGLGYISHLKIPMKPSPVAKLRFPISQTPIRFGEDENRYFNMVCLDPDIPARLYGLHALSPEAIIQMSMQLINDPNPSTIDKIDMSTDHITRTNHVIGIFNHMLATIGVDSQNTKCKVKDVISLPKSQRFESLEEAFRNVLKSYGYDYDPT